MSDEEFSAGYRRFCRQVNRYMSTAGIPSNSVKFGKDRDKLQYYASIRSEGMRIFGRPSGLSLTVKFYNGHQAMVRA